MADEFIITCTDGTSHLKLRSFSRDHFVAQLRSRGLEASVPVLVYQSGGLGTLFLELAENWKGWTGKKAWSSLEDELALEATADRAGHVLLAVSLQHGSPFTWRVEARLVVEAGQLDGLAVAAREFEAKVISAP